MGCSHILEGWGPEVTLTMCVVREVAGSVSGCELGFLTRRMTGKDFLTGPEGSHSIPGGYPWPETHPLVQPLQQPCSRLQQSLGDPSFTPRRALPASATLRCTHHCLEPSPQTLKGVGLTLQEEPPERTGQGQARS